MCGINGIVSLKPVQGLQYRLETMNQKLEHRGPDADRVKIFSEGIGLGHRRLSIIDLDKRSDQPMVSNSEKTVIVFNGEIFNYQSLKNELESDYRFCTQSDTEVLLAGYEIKGLDWLVTRINGMFAFALYDKEKQQFILVRDRFGMKPLYYFHDKEQLVFSSEIKGILHSGLVDADFNEKAIDDYLAYRYVREPYTFFKHIFRLPSASYSIFQNGKKVKEKEYWHLADYQGDPEYDEKSLIEETRAEVEGAITRWQIADVKVGGYLSGGVDSSLTSAVLAKNIGKNLHTYTIGFPEEGFDESGYAQMVADRYQTNHKAYLLQQDGYLEEWLRLIDYKDEPIAVPNEIPLSIMTSNLSEDITVAISGEGADELFGGYGRIFRSPFDYESHQIKVPYYQYLTDLYEYVPRTLRDSFLSTTGNYRKEFDAEMEADFSKYPNEMNIFRFFHRYHIKSLLNRIDTTSMQTSVEGRPPFMDHELVDFVYAKIPYDLKVKWKNEEAKLKAKTQYAQDYSEILDIPKYVLKKAAEPSLPNEVIYRKKVGFPVPLNKWFPKMTDLSNDILSKSDWLKNDAVTNLSKEAQKVTTGRSGQILWMFLNIEIFKQKYFNKTWKY